MPSPFIVREMRSVRAILNWVTKKETINKSRITVWGIFLDHSADRFASMNSPFKNSALKRLQVLIVSPVVVVDAHIVLLFASIPGETHDQQVKARHHGSSSSSGGRHIASVQVHPQFWVTATHYDAVFLRLSHAKSSDALRAHKTDGRTTERVSAETDLQYGDIHKSNSVKLVGRGNRFRPLVLWKKTSAGLRRFSI